MMTYLLQVSTCWIVFYGIYIFVLQKETFFTINRYYLLSGIMIGLMIPFLGGFIPANQTSIEIYHAMEQISIVEITPYIESKKSVFTWLNLLYLVYTMGSLIVFLRLSYGLSKIYSFYKNATKTKNKKYTLVESLNYHLPFSFFHFIFISKELPLNEDIEKIMKHEELHVKQWHSLDIIFMELLQVFFWFNPILIFYKNALKQSHEFLADAYVTKDHNRSSYGQLLLRQSTSGLEIALANHFFHSQIKKRITMMYKEKSKRPAMAKYLAAIPFLAAMLFIFSSSQMNDHVIPEETSNESLMASTQNLLSTNEQLKNNEEDQGDPIYKVVEEMPRFPGCDEGNASSKEKEQCAREKMLEFIYQNLTYPSNARAADIEGVCVIQFVVEKDGKISDGKIVRGIGGDCGNESLRVINSMPNWIPGKQKGEAVRVRFNLPVKFKLEDKKLSAEEKNQILNVVAFGKKSDKAIKDNLTIQNQNSVPNNTMSDDLFKVVEEMPRFPGCENSGMTLSEKEECAKGKMLEFIYTQIKYPREARDKGVEGMVVVQMIIEKDGSVSSSLVVRDPGAGTGSEAKRIVDLMPKWIPGKQQGKNVRVQYVLPIKYKLEGDKKDTYEVDQVPFFPGTSSKEESKNAILNFVFENVKYPKEAIQSGIEGLALVKFVITSKGQIKKVHITKSLGWGIDESVLKMVDIMKEIEMPWTPAIDDNKSVNFEYELPVKFKLQDSQKADSRTRILDMQNMNIKPNPSNGIFQLTFNIEDKTPADVIFYSAIGQTIKTLKQVNVPFSKSIDLSDFKGQTVFVRILQKDKAHTEKIIIQ